MTSVSEIKTFDDLSEKHSAWIIKFRSITFSKPLFFIWYRNNDKNETEHILSYKNGDIFATHSLNEIKKELQSLNKDLINFETIKPWIDNFKELKTIESCTYDLNLVVKNLEKTF